MKRHILFVSLIAITVSTVAGPVELVNWTPGLIQGRFNSSWETMLPAYGSDYSDVVSGVLAANQKCSTSSLSFSDPISGKTYEWNYSNTTFAYWGYMYMVAGKTYTFGENFDDGAYLKIDGKVLINEGFDGWFNYAQFTPPATGWYEIDVRLTDAEGNKGGWGNNGWDNTLGFAYRADGGTAASPQSSWKRLMDPGDGSLLRTVGKENNVFTGEIPGVQVSISEEYEGCVNIDYSLDGVADVSQLKDHYIKMLATDTAGGTNIAMRSFKRIPVLKSGLCRAIWKKERDASAIPLGDISVKLYVELRGNYCVIDVSSGPDAEAYPVEYLNAIPGGTWPEEYKTEKIVLALYPASTYTMGSGTSEVGYNSTHDAPQHQVTISKAHYFSVFLTTQRQYELVMGNNPSFFTNHEFYATRPVEQVTWNMIRGDSSTYNWPNVRTIGPDSFMGRLARKSGFPNMDLPTEAIWECVCRAQSQTSLNSGKNLSSTTEDSNLNKLARYRYTAGGDAVRDYATADCNASYGTAPVGSYNANNAKIYDMHGNVYEWCLDWYQPRSSFSTAAVTDPVGPATGDARVCRGGCFTSNARWCRSADRNVRTAPGEADCARGFRICATVSETKIVAAIGDDCYSTVANALANANEGAEIVLLQDVDENVTIVLDACILNLNGYTINGNLYLQNMDATKTVTVKNGTISGAIDGVQGNAPGLNGLVYLENVNVPAVYGDGHAFKINGGNYGMLEAEDNCSFVIEGGDFEYFNHNRPYHPETYCDNFLIRGGHFSSNIDCRNYLDEGYVTKYSAVNTQYPISVVAKAGDESNEWFPLSNGIVAYLPMNGSAKDFSGNGNDGIVEGAMLTSNRLGQLNKAYAFNGEYDYIRIKNSPSIQGITNGMSLAVWLNIGDWAINDKGKQCPWVPIISNNDTTDESDNPLSVMFTRGGGGYADADSIRVNGYDGDYASIGGDLEFNRWFHLIVTIGAGKFSVYIDGELRGEQVFRNSWASSTNDVIIAKDPPGSTEWYKGSMSEFVLYDRVLLADEITQLANGGCPVAEACDISSAEITLAEDSFEFDGEAKCPAVTAVMLNGVALVNEEDYVVSYDSNVNAGTAKVVITGKGYYHGYAVANFSITTRALQDAEVGQVEEVSLVNGRFVVTLPVSGLSETDYHLEYESNDREGVATVKVVGDGNYSGVISRQFVIPFGVIIVSAKIRDNDSSVMDVTYRVASSTETVKTRALAFADGERSFAKAVRPETFIDDTMGNLGDAVAANENHNLSWRVSDDWGINLSKVKFEVLAVKRLLMPVRFVKIPGSDEHDALVFSVTEVSSAQVMDALFWLYANNTEGLTLENGVLKNGEVVLADGSIPAGAAATAYVYEKMGYQLLVGEELDYVNGVSRLNLQPDGIRQYAYKLVNE